MARARFLAAVPIIADPTPTSSVLTNENFDEGGNPGDALATTNTTMIGFTGSGSMWLSDEQVRTGALSALVDGTAQHYGTNAVDASTDYPAHDTHLHSPYWYHDRNPSSPAWLWGVRDGTDSAFAFQYGFDDSGHLIGRDAGSGSADATSSGTCPTGAWYRLVAGAANGVVVIGAFTGATEDSSNMADAVATVSFAISSTAFTNDTFGIHETITGTGSPVGNLFNESFEGGSNGAQCTDSNTAYDNWLGTAATATFISAQHEDGALCCQINGSAYRYGLRVEASHTKHVDVVRIRYVSGPTSGSAYFWEARNGADNAVAAQAGIQSDGKLRIRDSNSGTAVATASAIPTNAWLTVIFVLDPSLSGTNKFTCYIYNAAGTLLHTLNSALTATSFSNAKDGLIAASTGTVVYQLDHIASDNSTIPYGTSAIGIRGWCDRVASDAATSPPPLERLTNPPTSGVTLVPTSGAMIGGTFAASNVNGSTSATGLTQWRTAVGGNEPDIVSIYRSGVFNALSATELAYFNQAGVRRVALIHWKINSGGATWEDVANGERDDDINQFCQRIEAAFNVRILMALPHHEPEDDVDNTPGSGYTAANYVAMCRRFVSLVRAYFGGDPPMDFVQQYVGYSSWAQNGAGDGFEDLYAGDDCVDIIGFDPYTHSSTRDTFDELVNENIASVSGWPGFHDHMREYHPTKPMMLCEFGVDMDTGTGMSVAQAVNVINHWAAEASSFPWIRLFAYWNSQTANGQYQIQLAGRTTAAAAMQALVESPWFTQDTSEFP